MLRVYRIGPSRAWKRDSTLAESHQRDSKHAARMSDKLAVEKKIIVRTKGSELGAEIEEHIIAQAERQTTENG